MIAPIVHFFLSIFAALRLYFHRKRHTVEFVGNAVFENSKPLAIENELELRTSTDKPVYDELLFSFAGSGSRLVFSVLSVQSRSAADGTRTEVGSLFIETADGERFALPEDGFSIVPERGMDEEGDDVDTYKSQFNLECKVVHPMKKWRISFNGLLKRIDDEADMRLYHVKFCFVFTEFARPFVQSLHSHPDVLAAGLVKHGFSYLQTWDQLESCEQWGQLVGTLYVEFREPSQLVMRGAKRRSFGRISCFTDGSFTSDVWHVFCDNGGLFTFTSDSRLPESTAYHIQPYIHFHTLKAMKPANCRIEDESKITCDYGSFELKKKAEHVTIARDEVASLTIDYFALLEDGKEAGWAMRRTFRLSEVAMWKCIESTILNLPRHIRDADEHRSALCVSTTSTSALISSIVGGKAVQLATLLQQMDEHAAYTVPNAVVITTAAFNLYMQTSKTLQNIVHEIKEGCSKGDDNAIRDACQRAHRSIVEHSELPAVLLEALAAQLNSEFGATWSDSTLFAVRSSAVGEDGVHFSSAGQMETILNVSGMASLKSAILTCWASSLAWQVVEYRRNHGVLPVLPMAVVVQKMVPAEKAGVLFTCDPLTGHPGKLVITAASGLGEQVVAGTVTPDTVTVERSSISSQDKKISFSISSNNKDICLSEKEIEQLSRVALLVERIFDSPRDIEWAIADGRVFLLQARPITTLDVESEYEMIHEFDHGFRTDFEYSTRANVGEVAPEPHTPLTTYIGPCSMSIASHMAIILMRGGKTVDGRLGFWRREIGVNSRAGFPMIQQYVLLDLLTLYVFIGATDRRVIDLCILGRPFDDGLIDGVVEQRLESSWYWWFWAKIERLPTFWPILSRNFFVRLERLSTDSLSVPLDCSLASTSAEMFHRIVGYLPTFYTVTVAHGPVSSAVMIVYNVIMAIITNSSRDWTPVHYCDVATLLSTCTEVVSADVPEQIRLLAKKICDAGLTEHFLALSPQAALSWLQDRTGNREIAESFAQFLLINGHRAINEMELRVQGWAQEPLPLVLLLQSLVKQPKSLERTKSEIGVDEAIALLESPLSSIQKFLLRKLLPRARYAVGLREKTKSNLVKTADRLKTGIRTLGQLLVRELRIPDVDLVFFLTIHELERLTGGNQPEVVARAVKRRRLYPKLREYELQEISVGFPRPIEASSDEDGVSILMELAGTPVCKGIAKGPCRVVKDITNAHEIRQGDILVTVFTDIGWTPYFALLAGVVTELGGILSHGAVIAREYGIPCLVNVKGATSGFRSGDTVLLDAKQGFLKKVQAD